jgi:Tol biopolymer transport system component
VPRWSPDGTEIVFAVDRMDDEAFETGAAVAVVPATGGEPRYLTSFDDWAYNPDWSWVTDEIVYGDSIRDLMRDYDPAAEASDIFIIRPDGTGRRQLTHAASGEHFRGPRWMPDSTALTAYHIPTYSHIVADPTTGLFEPMLTLENEQRPLVRPTP